MAAINSAMALSSISSAGNGHSNLVLPVDNSMEPKITNPGRKISAERRRKWQEQRTLSRSDPSFDADAIIESSGQICWKNEMEPEQSVSVVQFESILSKAKTIPASIDTLEELTNKMTEMDNIEDTPEEEKFIQTTFDINNEILDIFGLLDSVLIEHLSFKQISILRDIRTTSNPAQDISIRFFGLPWNEIRILMNGLLVHLANLKDCFTNIKFDVVLPSLVINDLNKLHEDLVSHAEALLKGRLNRRQNALIREQQIRHREFLNQLCCRKRKTFDLRRSLRFKLRHPQKLLPSSISWTLSRQNSYGDKMEDKGRSRSSLEEAEELWKAWYKSIQQSSNLACQLTGLRDHDGSDSEAEGPVGRVATRS